MTSGSFASSYVETVRLLDPTCHNFRTLSVRNPRNSVAKYPLFLRNTLTPAPRNNVARYNLVDRRFNEGRADRLAVSIAFAEIWHELLIVADAGLEFAYSNNSQGRLPLA